jgi:hypothetical protein
MVAINPFAAATPTETDMIDEMCGLTKTQRLYGFGITFAVLYPSL